MKLLFGHVCLTLVVFLGATNPHETLDEPEILQNKDDAGSPSDPLQELGKTVKSMKSTMAAMGRQMMLQQLFIEEKIRSDASSGVKQIRHSREGTRNYYANTHSGRSVLAIHDHSNNDRTVGMGEFVGVLNGVEFRTRHNDYRLYMPHRTSGDYHAVENIPFPDVPPEVTNKASVNEQVKEMTEWFKAFKNQDHSVRDYRKYFKPIICYLEGAWTTATKGAIDEGFDSDRHFIDAKSWFDLQEKIRFTSYTGRKDNLENFSYLPTTVMNMTEEGYLQFAQWNYRIACAPIDRDIPLNRLRVVDELDQRIAGQRTFDEHAMTRAARFQLNPFDRDDFREGSSRAWGLLDEIMSKIPGKDNYQGNHTDEAFDLSAYSIEPGKNGKLRADRYHRWFKVAAKGAMGLSLRHRGYADENLFMAMNTQPKVAGMQLETCKGRGKWKKCKYMQQKWSYAIPLEIIYLSPLSKWNPYDLHYKGSFQSTLAKTVEAGGRNGGKTVDKAYNGTHSKRYYQTPVEFFTGAEVGSDPADTTQSSVGVLDKQGVVRQTAASGTRIFFPAIFGIGKVRQRYPIMPVHGEGSSVWKELEALKDLVLKSKTNGYIFREPLQSGPLPTKFPRRNIRFQMPAARSKKTGPHNHVITVTPDELDFIVAGGYMEFTTTQASSHTHDIAIRWHVQKKKFVISTCDHVPITSWLVCWDLHPYILVQMPN